MTCPARTHVRDVPGVEPEEFVTIARRYAARPESRRTTGNLARALWDFLLIGVTPSINASHLSAGSAKREGLEDGQRWLTKRRLCVLHPTGQRLWTNLS